MPSERPPKDHQSRGTTPHALSAALAPKRSPRAPQPRQSTFGPEGIDQPCIALFHAAPVEAGSGWMDALPPILPSAGKLTTLMTLTTFHRGPTIPLD